MGSREPKKERRSIALGQDVVDWYNKFAEECGFSAHFLMQEGIYHFMTYLEKTPAAKQALLSLRSGRV